MTVAMPDALAKLREAADLIELAARDDRETIGELAGAVHTHDVALAAIRQAIDSLASAVEAIDRRMSDPPGAVPSPAHGDRPWIAPNPGFVQPELRYRVCDYSQDYGYFDTLAECRAFIDREWPAQAGWAIEVKGGRAGS